MKHSKPNQRPMEKSGSPSTIVFCGATGVGKSSVINMLADHDPRSKPAQTGNTAKGVTSLPRTFSKRLDGREYHVIDTVGLGEGMRGAVPTDKAIASLYDVFTRPGGINLVVFVLRCRPLNQASINYYNILKLLCHPAVPIVLVVTGVENEEDWSQWWNRQQPPLGFTFTQNTCVVSSEAADRSEKKPKFKESQQNLVKMITTTALSVPYQVTRRPAIPHFVTNVHRLLREKKLDFHIALDRLLREWRSPAIIFVGTTVNGTSLIDMLPDDPQYASEKGDTSASDKQPPPKNREHKKLIDGLSSHVFEAVDFGQGTDGSTLSPEAIKSFYDLLVSRPSGFNLIVLAPRVPGSAVDYASHKFISLLCGTSVPVVVVHPNPGVGKQNTKGGRVHSSSLQVFREIELDPTDGSRTLFLSAIAEAVVNFPVCPATSIGLNTPQTLLSRILSIFRSVPRVRKEFYSALVEYGVRAALAKTLCKEMAMLR